MGAKMEECIRDIIKAKLNKVFFLGYYCGILVLMVIYLGMNVIKAIIEGG
jgi:hypothetical protein